MDEGRYNTVAACARFEGELEAYLEGEVRPFVISHSQGCPSCGALLSDLQSIRQTARLLPQEEPSPLLWAKVSARLAANGAFTPPACLRFEDELQAYLEGEGEATYIPSHARECAPCNTLLSDLQNIRQAARELPQEEPSPVVWANIHARLEAEGAWGRPVRGWREIFGWHAFPQAVPLGVLALLIFMGSLLTLPSANLRIADERVVKIPEMASVTLPAGEDSVLANLASNLEKDFRAREASMAPDLKATYEKSLVSLDGSIRECLDSLQHEPGNTLAHDYLLTAYTRKAEVLTSALEFEGR